MRPGMSTQIHIRCARTGRYLSRDGAWTTQPQTAREFSTAREAEDYCRQEQVAEAEVIITRENHPPLTIRVKFHR